MLRFGARLVTSDAKEKEREFIIKLHLFDSTVSIFEVPKINSG